MRVCVWWWERDCSALKLQVANNRQNPRQTAKEFRGYPRLLHFPKTKNKTTQHTRTQKSKLSTHIAPCARYFCACHKGYNMLLPPHWLKKGGGVNRSYLGNSVVFQLVLVRPRCVHPKTFACCHATSTSCTLIGWCLRRRTFHTGHKSTRTFFQYG